jgi:hypothetical protein
LPFKLNWYRYHEGWSFWAFFSAVHWTLLVTSLYLFVEVGPLYKFILNPKP